MTEITIDRIREQYARNAAQLREMAQQATGRRTYRGLPPEGWAERAARFTAIAALPDEALRAHVSSRLGGAQ